VRRIAAIAGVAGKQRPIAQVLTAAATIGTDAAGVAEPGDADTLADREAGDPLPHRGDPPDDLVAGHDRKLRVRQLAVDNMQIGTADAAGHDLDQDFAGRGRERAPLAHDQRRVRFLEHHRAHDQTSRHAKATVARSIRPSELAATPASLSIFPTIRYQV
jgi:hypothetical protein